MPSGKTKVDIGTRFRALSSVALSLNKCSDELTHSVGILDGALRTLNIGLTTWVSFATWEVESPEYGADQIGYAKVGGKWGIALRTIWGNENYADDGHEEGPWLFGESPRELRIRAVDHLPQLVEELGKKAFSTAHKLHEKAKEVSALAAVVEEIAKEREDGVSRGEQ